MASSTIARWGIGRNSERASGQVTLNMFLGYQFAFGRSAPLPPGVGVFGGGNSAQVRTFDQGTARYRLQFFVAGEQSHQPTQLLSATAAR